MNELDIAGGVVLIILGIWLVVRKIRLFSKNEQGDLGYDIKGLILGIGFIIFGILIIFNS